MLIECWLSIDGDVDPVMTEMLIEGLSRVLINTQPQMLLVHTIPKSCRFVSREIVFFPSQVVIELGCSHWAAALGAFLATFGEILLSV